MTETSGGEGARWQAPGTENARQGPAGISRLSEGQEDLHDLSTGELVSRLSEQVTRLVKDELALAQTELKQKGKRAGLGAGIAGMAVPLSLLGLAALVTAAIAALARVLPLWASGIVVGVALLLIAGLLALAGVAQAKRAVPPLPEGAIESTKRDIETVKESARR